MPKPRPRRIIWRVHDRASEYGWFRTWEHEWVWSGLNDPRGAVRACAELNERQPPIKKRWWAKPKPRYYVEGIREGWLDGTRYLPPIDAKERQ